MHKICRMVEFKQEPFHVFRLNKATHSCFYKQTRSYKHTHKYMYNSHTQTHSSPCQHIYLYSLLFCLFIQIKYLTGRKLRHTQAYFTLAPYTVYPFKYKYKILMHKSFVLCCSVCICILFASIYPFIHIACRTHPHWNTHNKRSTFLFSFFCFALLSFLTNANSFLSSRKWCIDFLALLFSDGWCRVHFAFDFYVQGKREKKEKIKWNLVNV